MTRIYLRKEEATAKNWYSCKELKELFRLKPARGQVHVGEVWQGQGTYLVYDKKDCVAMRPYRKPTAKQLAALAEGRECLGSKRCATEGCDGRIYYDYESGRYCNKCKEARRLESIRRTCLSYENHEKPICFLDKKTTGLDANAEIIEIAIIDRSGKTLLDTLVKPNASIQAEASAIHGIYDCDVENAPSFAEIFEQVKAIYETHLVLIYNASFDNRLITQSAASHCIEFDAEQYNTSCLMQLYAEHYNEYNDYHKSYEWQSLSSAAYHCDIKIDRAAHRARSDCLTAQAVYNYLLNQYMLNIKNKKSS